MKPLECYFNTHVKQQLLYETKTESIHPVNGTFLQIIWIDELYSWPAEIPISLN